MEFVDVETAKSRSGMRLVTVGGLPSPWSEAAKGLIHVKKIPCVGVRFRAGDAAVMEWTGKPNAPVACWDDEPGRDGWAEILLLCERVAPGPRLVPEDAAERAMLFGIAHEICGEMGLGWCRRLQGIAAGLEGHGGFPRPAAEYLAPRYGYRPGAGEQADRRVIEILGMLSDRLKRQRDAGSDFYLGDSLGALDVYSATFMALVEPLPAEQCPMPEPLRAAFAQKDEATAAAVDPILLEHRDRIYAEHLELPITL